MGLPVNPDTKTLRRFGFVALPGFLFMASVLHYSGGVVAVLLGSYRIVAVGAFLVLAILCPTLSFLRPAANAPVFNAMIIATYPIAVAMRWLIITILFFGVLGTVALISRLNRRDPLALGFDLNAETYWIATRKDYSLNSYFRPY